MREALKAYQELARRDALDSYRFDLLMYAIAAQWGGKVQKPEVPTLLKEIVRGSHR